jgi:hypothetical protein
MRMIRQTVLDFKIESTKEQLTAHGGLALLAEYHHGMGLKQLSDRHLPGPASNRGYAPSAFLESLVLMLQAGGQTLEDLRELEQEAALMELLNQEEIPDPDTVGDWLRRMGDPQADQGGLHGLGQVRDLLNQRLLRHDGISEYTLDADAMQIEAEKREAAWTYQGVQGYMPLLGFLFENSLCLHEEFREGNVSPIAGQLPFYRQCRQRIPESKRIAYYRADSASYQADLINALEEDGVIWALTADQDRAVKEAIRKIPEADWKEPILGCGYEVAETVHTLGRTLQAFRLIVKRELRRQTDLFAPERYFYHAVASNWPSEQKNAAEVLAWHNRRGQAENFLKELKGGFGLDRLPCGQGFANAVFFRIGLIAYNLFLGFKRLSCPESWWHHTIATFRWKLIQVAGRIVYHAGQRILKLALDGEKLMLFRSIRKRCFELASVT